MAAHPGQGDQLTVWAVSLSPSEVGSNLLGTRAYVTNGNDDNTVSVVSNNFLSILFDIGTHENRFSVRVIGTRPASDPSRCSAPEVVQGSNGDPP